jgi:hypothetical protein
MNPPGAFQPNINSSNFSLVCVIYRTDVVNDQVIITLSTPAGVSLNVTGGFRTIAFDAVRYRKPLRYIWGFDLPVLAAVMMVFFKTSNTAAVS